GAGAAGAAVDDPQDVERQDPALAPRGDDPGRRDRRPRHWIGARARITRGWPERDAFRLSFARLWAGGHAGHARGLRAPRRGARVRLAVGERPRRAAVAHRLALSLQ